jgi:nitronate monooxygenase
MGISKLEIPILQAPVEATVDLAAAVSEAGGMGSIQGTWNTPDETAELVEGILNKTSCPFFVNFALAFTPHSFDAVIEAGVPVITFSWGLEPGLIERAHRNNVAVGVQVGSVDGAKLAITKGADFVICQGIEAGGHVQSTTSLANLLPRVVASVGEVPVFAAGGLADSDDIAWALHEGATGVMLGTRFVATQESVAHELYKESILASSGSDTVYTVCFDGGWSQAPHRVIRNRTLKIWEDAGCPPPGKRPGEGEIVANDSSGYEIKRYDSDTPAVSFIEGEMRDLCLYAGMGCDKIHDIPSASELVLHLWKDYQLGKKAP